MTKNAAASLALLLAGFVAGAVSGASAMGRPAKQPAAGSALVSATATHTAATVEKVYDVAIGCGVYGLPGSPAVVALVAGPEGRPVKAGLESDIFGGDDAERCIVAGLAGLPMTSDTLRVVLPVHQPSDALATR
jgi:hypothetical protein